jgi:hypothetical protein
VTCFLHLGTFVPVKQHSQNRWSNTCIHTTHALSPKGQQRRLRYSSVIPTFYQNHLAMSSTADVTGGKPIAVWSQSISGVNAIYPLVAFYNIHGRKREVLFYFVRDTTRDSWSDRWSKLAGAPPCFGTDKPLAFTNPHWIRVMDYSPVSLRVMHKGGLCPSSGALIVVKTLW